MDYFKISEMTSSHGKSYKDAIVLSPQNDPFYVHTKAKRQQAEWFKDCFEKYVKPNEQVHLRRFHYRLFAHQELHFDGKPYVVDVDREPNKKLRDKLQHKHWIELQIASKYARWLGLIPFEQVIDKRNDLPLLFHPPDSEPSISIYGSSDTWDFNIPEFPYPPSYDIEDFEPNVRYHLTLWIEKDTVTDILSPICDRFGADLITGKGHTSLTRPDEMLRRITAYGKTARVFYISDYDKAGESMPIAMIRKIEKRIEQTCADVDIKMWPIALTAEQVSRLGVPTASVMGDRGKEREVAELDALPELFPGELEKIVESVFSHYRDETLQGRVKLKKAELQYQLDDIREAVIDPYRGQIKELKKAHEALAKKIEESFTAIHEELSQIYSEIEQGLEDNAFTFDIPAEEVVEDLPNALFDSSRNYWEQLIAYKQQQAAAKDEEYIPPEWIVSLINNEKRGKK